MSLCINKCYRLSGFTVEILLCNIPHSNAVIISFNSIYYQQFGICSGKCNWSFRERTIYSCIPNYSKKSNIGLLQYNKNICINLTFFLNQEVDFSYLAIAPSLDLWRIMDFTSVSLQEMFVFLIPWPEEESRLTAVIRPFNLMV